MPVAKMSSLEDCKFLCGSRKTNVIAPVHSQNTRRLLYLYYRPLNCGSSKNWTSRNLCYSRKFTNNKYIYTQIDFNHSDLESRNGRNTLKYIKRNQNNYVQKQKQWNLLYVLFVFLICSSLWNLKRKKRLFRFKQSFNTQRTKRKLKVFMKGVW